MFINRGQWVEKLNPLSPSFTEILSLYRDGITPVFPFASSFVGGEGLGKREVGLYKRGLEKGESQECWSIFLALDAFHLTISAKAQGSSHPLV